MKGSTATFVVVPSVACTVTCPAPAVPPALLTVSVLATGVALTLTLGGLKLHPGDGREVAPVHDKLIVFAAPSGFDSMIVDVSVCPTFTVLVVKVGPPSVNWVGMIEKGSG